MQKINKTLIFGMMILLALPLVSAGWFGFSSSGMGLTSSSQTLLVSSVTANVYHGNIDWVYTIIGTSGNTACNNLDNKVSGYSYTCQTVIDTAGSTVGCGTTLLTLNANTACKVD